MLASILSHVIFRGHAMAAMGLWDFTAFWMMSAPCAPIAFHGSCSLARFCFLLFHSFDKCNMVSVPGSSG